MADYLTTDTELTSVADAIRTKGGTSAALEWPDGFAQAIEDIPSGGGAQTVIKSVFPNYLWIYSSVTTDGNYSYADVEVPATAGTTMYIHTVRDYVLSSITRDDTGTSVPFTEISYSSSSGGVYSFTMPDSSVTYDLYYDD